MDSPLMKLPGELRNEIYRHALVEANGQAVVIDDHSAAEPGLLSTCKQIRNECRDIYYLENAFIVDLTKLTPAVIKKWLWTVAPDKTLRRSLPQTEVAVVAERRFKFLSEWIMQTGPDVQNCRALHGRMGQGQVYPVGSRMEGMRLVGEVFKLAYNRSKHESGSATVRQCGGGSLDARWLVET